MTKTAREADSGRNHLNSKRQRFGKETVARLLSCHWRCTQNKECKANQCELSWNNSSTAKHWETNTACLLYQTSHTMAGSFRTKLRLFILSLPRALLIVQVHARSVHCVGSDLTSVQKFTLSLNLGVGESVFLSHIFQNYFHAEN